MAIATALRGGGRAALLAGALCLGAACAAYADDAPTLIETVKAKDQDAALAMIAHKADVRAREPDGTTALHWAAHEGEVEVVRALVRAGADVSARTITARPRCRKPRSPPTPRYSRHS